MLRLDPVEPGRLLRPGQLRRRPLREGEKRLRMRSTNRGFFPRAGEGIEPELSHDLQHPDPSVAVGVAVEPTQEALVGEIRRSFDDWRLRSGNRGRLTVLSAPGNHRVRQIQRAAAREDGKPPKDELFIAS